MRKFGALLIIFYSAIASFFLPNCEDKSNDIFIDTLYVVDTLIYNDTVTINDTVVVITDTIDLAYKGLIGYWNFDSTIKDKGPLFNRTDSIGNNLVFVDDRNGGSSRALNFSKNSFLEVRTNEFFENISSAITIACWINVDAPFNSNGDVPLIHKLSANTQSEVFQYRLLWNTASGKIIFGFKNSQEVDKWQDLPYPMTIQDQPLNEWFHIAVTYDGKEVTYYLNGQLWGTVSYVGKIYPNGHNISVGRDPHGGDEYLRGSLDELKIYNIVLDENEINILAN